MSEEEKKILLPEVLDAIDEEESRSKAYQKIKHYADTVKNPTAKKFVDWDEFQRAAQRFMPLNAIAPSLGVSVELLNNRCKKVFGLTSRDVWKKFAADGKRILTSTMYSNAVKNNNTAMQIWLSKTQMEFQEPEKKIIDPNKQNAETIKEIKWGPTIKGFKDCSPEKMQEFMAEFLDLPVGHKANKDKGSGKNATDIIQVGKDEEV